MAVGITTGIALTGSRSSDWVRLDAGEGRVGIVLQMNRELSSQSRRSPSRDQLSADFAMCHHRADCVLLFLP